MDAQLRALVRSRAQGKCEYCSLKQSDQQFHRFHVEHIVPQKHGGATVEGTLCLACRNCNLHKGPNLTGIDPETGIVMELFHPRNQAWVEYFRFEGAAIVGITSTGRTTVRVLSMNDPDQLELRSLLQYGK